MASRDSGQMVRATRHMPRSSDTVHMPGHGTCDLGHRTFVPGIVKGRVEGCVEGC